MGKGSGNGRVRPIFVLSNATGEAGFRLTEAMLVAFKDHDDVRTFSEVQSPKKIRQIMASAAREQAFVVCTLEADALQRVAATTAAQLDVELWDIIREGRKRIAAWRGERPAPFKGRKITPQRLAIRRATEFVRLHEDGRLLRDLTKADAVVLGVSRAGKTPVCQALARHGVSASDVPLVLPHGLPSQWLGVDPLRVFLLWAHPQRLRDLRTNRGTRAEGYADEVSIEAELRMSRSLHSRNPKWTRLDTTSTAPEDTAMKICAELERRFGQKIWLT